MMKVSVTINGQTIREYTALNIGRADEKVEAYPGVAFADTDRLYRIIGRNTETHETKTGYVIHDRADGADELARKILQTISHEGVR